MSFTKRGRDDIVFAKINKNEKKKPTFFNLFFSTVFKDKSTGKYVL
jgi:hypothetical protein